MKICVIGCGLRTPLLVHGLSRSELRISQIVLHDVNPERARLMSRLGAAIAEKTPVHVVSESTLERAVQDAVFVISSIRVGDMETRARDERLALECGFAGQETTGPAGFAMALRAIPIALQHAKTVQEYAPHAWIINFTNPAGIITQALSVHAASRVVGICDTPAELIHQIRCALDEPSAECDYFGLNHLGWIRAIRINGEDLLGSLLEDDARLRRLYPSALFPPSFLRTLRLLPTEYLFYYYRQRLARSNQIKAGATRGEELQSLNTSVLDELRRSSIADALHCYRRYLNRRNASYMRLEGAAESAFHVPEVDWNPFEGATGYHRIAVEAIRALSESTGRNVILNVPNRGSIDGLASDDVVEVPCAVNSSGAQPVRIGEVPQAVRGLMLAVKSYERLTVQAAVEQRRDLLTLALMSNPIVGDWDAANEFVMRLMESDRARFSGLT